MLDDICRFSLDGVVEIPSRVMSVSRVGDFLMLDFINNASIQLKIKGNDLLITDRVVATFSGSSLTARISFNTQSVYAYVHLTDGDRSFYFTAGVAGDISVADEQFVTDFEDYEVSEWCEIHGIKRPEGGGWCSTWTSGSTEYYIEQLGYLIRCDLPNGFVLPVVYHNRELLVVQDRYGVGNGLNFVFVREIERTESKLSLRLIFVCDNATQFFELDGVEVARDCVSFNGHSIGAVEITKRLVMFGG